jgi:hypothetical protein
MTSGPPVSAWPEALRDEYEEKAGVLEHDQGNSRRRAEWLAYNEVLDRRKRKEAT